MRHPLLPKWGAWGQPNKLPETERLPPSIKVHAAVSNEPDERSQRHLIGIWDDSIALWAMPCSAPGQCFFWLTGRL